MDNLTFEVKYVSFAILYKVNAVLFLAFVREFDFMTRFLTNFLQIMQN